MKLIKIFFFSMILIPVALGSGASAIFSDPDTPVSVDISADFDLIGSIGSRFQKRSPFSSNGFLKIGSTQYPAVIRPRGNSRIDYCEGMKPLRVKFSLGAPTFGPLKGINKKLKIVTHCNLNPDTIQPWIGLSPNEVVLMEFYRYRVSQILLGEDSFQVKLAAANYHSLEGKKVSYGNAILLESVSDIASRLGGNIIGADELVPIEDWEIWPKLRDKPKWFIKKSVYHQRRFRYVKKLIGSELDLFKTLVDLYIPARVLRASGDLTIRDNNEAFLVKGVIHFVPYDYDLDSHAWFGRESKYTEVDDDKWYPKYLGSHLIKLNVSDQQKAKVYTRAKIKNALGKILSAQKYIGSTGFRLSEKIIKVMEGTRVYYLKLMSDLE
ncbi:MAG: hypothetical protein HOE90_05750 [Bacteriovoracaceae bacterium]|nr:hypothetical protein [Bacteriovoracaceae bacterium]